MRLNKFLLRPSKFHVNDFIEKVADGSVEVEVSAFIEDGGGAPTIKVRLSETISLTGLVWWLRGVRMKKMQRKVRVMFCYCQPLVQIHQLKQRSCHGNEYLLQYQENCCSFEDL